MKQNLRKILSLGIAALAATSCSSGNNGYNIEAVDNAGGSAIYEIFVGSFCDSNGDGTGDLKGIESKLDYLKSLGVSYLWLTPIHPSPSYHKYDVKDYRAIDPKFGTLDDFASLAAKAKEKGIGIIMDMVFNHISKKSDWFQKWCQAFGSGDKTSPYYDNFSWSKTAKYGYSQMGEAGGVYVESNFDSGMPEFNLDSEFVRSELKSIQDYWLDKGASGFRYDAVMYYYCENNNGTIVGDTDKNVAFMKYLADSARAKKSDVYLVGEAWVNSQETIAAYAGSTMNAFNFPTAGIDAIGSAGKALVSGGAKMFMESLEKAQTAIKAANPSGDVCYFVSNHDMDRWGGYRSGRANAEEARKAVASIYLLTPGTPFMYYGEEIGMLGTRPSNAKTDAARRQAMVWGEGEAICAQPEGVTVEKQVTVGVKEAEKDGYSTLNHYRKVLSLRNKYKDMFRKGTFTAIDVPEDGIGFKVTLGEESFYLLHNTKGAELSFTLPGAKTLLESIDTMKTAASLSGETLKLPGYSSAIVR